MLHQLDVLPVAVQRRDYGCGAIWEADCRSPKTLLAGPHDAHCSQMETLHIIGREVESDSDVVWMVIATVEGFN